MTERTKSTPIIIVCVRCGKEHTRYGDTGMCGTCRYYFRRLEKFKDAPLIKCICRPECKTMIRAYGRWGQPNKYAIGHSGFLRSGKKSPSYKNGFVWINKKYRYQLFKGHPNADAKGYIMFHRIVFEMYHKCCLLSWTDIHHIDGNTKRNHPENLQPLFRNEHSSITHKGIKHKKKRYRRKCVECGSKTTPRRKNGTYKWYEVSSRRFRCDKCYRNDPKNRQRKLEWQREYRKKKKRLVITY
jgi:hypothetical protein